MNIGCKTNLSLGSGGTLYGPLSFRDEFTTALTAGNVNGSSCEPGSGTRTVVDTESKLTIADGKLTFSGGKTTPAYGDPGYWRGTAITRAAGQIGACKVTMGDVTSGFEFGFSNAKTGALVGNAFRVVSDTVKPYDGSTAGPTVSIPTDSAEVTKAVILRAAGAHFFRKIGSGYWRYLYSTSTNNTATLYLGFAGYSQSFLPDWVRSPFNKWLPTPRLSDGFSGTNGTSNDGRLSDGAGHAETTGLGSGGGGLSWSGASGAIQSNRLVITPTLGSELVTNGGCEDWTSDTDLATWTEAIAGGSTINKESSVTNGGSYSCRFDIDASNNNARISQSIVNPGGTWLCMSVYAKSSLVGKSLQFCTGVGGDVGPTHVLTTNYTKYTTVERVGENIARAIKRGTAASSSIYIDDVSFKPITLSTCFNTVTLPTADMAINCKFQMTSGTQAGVVLGLNDAGTSFILAYHTGNGSVMLEICESGTYTTKATVAATYSSDYVLSVRRDGTEIWVYYNNVLIGTGPTTTLSAGEDTNLRGTKCGLFSTSGGNSFDDVSVYYTGTNGEYSILDGLVGA